MLRCTAAVSIAVSIAVHIRIVGAIRAIIRSFYNARFLINSTTGTFVCPTLAKCYHVGEVLLVVHGSCRNNVNLCFFCLRVSCVRCRCLNCIGQRFNIRQLFIQRIDNLTVLNRCRTKLCSGYRFNRLGSVLYNIVCKRINFYRQTIVNNNLIILRMNGCFIYMCQHIGKGIVQLIVGFIGALDQYLGAGCSVCRCRFRLLRTACGCRSIAAARFFPAIFLYFLYIVRVSSFRYLTDKFCGLLILQLKCTVACRCGSINRLVRFIQNDIVGILKRLIILKQLKRKLMVIDCFLCIFRNCSTFTVCVSYEFLNGYRIFHRQIEFNLAVGCARTAFQIKYGQCMRSGRCKCLAVGAQNALSIFIIKQPTIHGFTIHITDFLICSIIILASLYTPLICGKVHCACHFIMNAANIQHELAVNEYPNIIVAGEIKRNIGRFLISSVQFAICRHRKRNNCLHAEMIRSILRRYRCILVKRQPRSLIILTLRTYICNCLRRCIIRQVRVASSLVLKMCRHCVRVKGILILTLVILERQTYIGVDLFAIAVRRIIRAEQARLGVRKDNIVARVQIFLY